MASRLMRQVTEIVVMNLRSVPARASTAAVAAIGIAGVVAVLVGVLSMSEGFRAVLDYSGADDVAIVLRGAATDEMSSGLTLAQTRVIADAPGIARDSAGAIASPELYVIVDLPLKSTGTAANAPLRGAGARAPLLRRGFRIVEGRMHRPGTFEVIVGRRAQQQYAGLELGRRLRLGATDWQVVGVFEDRGSVAQSEVWTDPTVLQDAYHRGSSFQSVRLRLVAPGSLPQLERTLKADPRLSVRVITERQFYREQSRILVTMIDTVGTTIALLMGLGAVFAALNTMYSIVAARTREIATLRAIGFGALPVVASVLVEALTLGLAGGTLGSIAAYFGFNGMQASTMNWASFTQITFAFTVTPRLVIRGLAYAMLLALVGGLLPAWRAARMPIVGGLRAL
jgi:putative ABC transport system permease protein